MTLSAEWPSSHVDALREFRAQGLSSSKAADAINARFSTHYSRNAAIGRGARLGLVKAEKPKPAPKKERPARGRAPQRHVERQRYSPESRRVVTIFASAEAVKLRCVEIVPRHLSLIDLEPGDCRYPYGGDADNEAITFCGHPKLVGSSYCTPHYHLSLGCGTASERAATKVSRRMEAVA